MAIQTLITQYPFSFQRKFFALVTIFSLLTSPLFAVGGKGWNSTQLCDQPHHTHYLQHLGVGMVKHAAEEGHGSGQILPNSDRRLVLTAKHCIDYEALDDDDSLQWPSFTQILEHSEMSEMNDVATGSLIFLVAGQQIPVLKTYQHPVLDIAIMLLAHSASVPEATLPSLPYETQWIGNKPMDVAAVGYGMTGPAPDRMAFNDGLRKRRGQLKIVRPEGSLDLFSHFSYGRSISTEIPISEDFTSPGDSGGPLLSLGRNQIVGVVTYGNYKRYNGKNYEMSGYQGVQVILPWLENGYYKFGFDPTPFKRRPKHVDHAAHLQAHPGLARLLEGKSDIERHRIIRMDRASLNTGNFHQNIPPSFNPLEYILSHPDLTALYAHLKAGALRTAAIEHWFRFGRYEGRVITLIPNSFDKDDYLASHPDLYMAYQHLNEDARDAAARIHWLTHGLKEGRTLSLLPDEFQPENYINANPDLVKAFAHLEGFEWRTAGEMHWLLHGRFEGRDLCRTPCFPWKHLAFHQFIGAAYILSHPDLLKLHSYLDSSYVASELIDEIALEHWFRHGKSEGRAMNLLPRGFDLETYVERNPAHFPTAKEKLSVWLIIKHWFDVGQYLKLCHSEMPEGFEAYRYVLGHEDLRHEYGHLEPRLLQFYGEKHWIEHGEGEGRAISTLPHNFNYKVYVLRNPDLTAALSHLPEDQQRIEAEKHWLRSGHSESGRVYSLPPAFNATSYILCHEDMDTLYGHLDAAEMERAAIEHWAKAGWNEMRTLNGLPDGFDGLRYVTLNPDLYREYGGRTPQEQRHIAEVHWLKSGQFEEGRRW